MPPTRKLPWPFGRGVRTAPADVPSAPQVAADDPVALRAAVQSIAKQASTLGREAAEVRGQIDDTRQGARRQMQALSTLAGQLQGVTQAQGDIGGETAGSVAAAACARKAVETIGFEITGIVDTLRQVSQVASEITQIALQTRLVAFNASVEAGRAGEAGRGFAVVANAVKDLSSQVERSSKAIAGTVSELDKRIDVLAREITVEASQAQRSDFQQALAQLEASVSRIAGAAQHSRAICDGLTAQVVTMDTEMQAAGRSLDVATAGSNSLLNVSEELIELVAECGVETDDTPFIRAAIDAAEVISRELEAALDQGAVTLDDLFDEHYQPVPGTAPPQHLTRFVALADRLFPPVQEPVLELNKRIVFCIAADRNGYIATHNQRYCQPQRGDLAWDTANSRYRRIFNDRTGLASARNTRPFLLQTYRRDMGGGKFVLLKEAAAPITVNGRHWGGLRLAFNF